MTGAKPSRRAVEGRAGDHGGGGDRVVLNGGPGRAHFRQDQGKGRWTAGSCDFRNSSTFLLVTPHSSAWMVALTVQLTISSQRSSPPAIAGASVMVSNGAIVNLGGVFEM